MEESRLGSHQGKITKIASFPKNFTCIAVIDVSIDFSLL